MEESEDDLILISQSHITSMLKFHLIHIPYSIYYLYNQ